MPGLWPQPGTTPPKTMAEMLYDAAGDLGHITNGRLDFYVDAIGMAKDHGPVTEIRYNCSIRVISKGYLHLFFRVTTPASGPFPAKLETPEGDRESNIKDQAALDAAIAKIMQRPRTQEVVDYLLRLAVPQPVPSVP